MKSQKRNTPSGHPATHRRRAHLELQAVLQRQLVRGLRDDERRAWSIDGDPVAVAQAASLRRKEAQTRLMLIVAEIELLKISDGIEAES